MEIIKKTIGGAEFDFCVSARDTRNGFAHDCELFSGDGREIARATCHYLNRTWERYRFQTVMLCAVDNAIRAVEACITGAEMERNGWKRTTAERRAALAALCDQNSGLQVLRELRAAVNSASYGTESEREELRSLEALNAMLEVLFKPATA